MDDSHRTKIANSQILNRLIGHVEGSVDLSATQVTAGVALLRKIMPDLETHRLEGEVTTNVISHKPLSPEEWAKAHGSAD